MRNMDKDDEMNDVKAFCKLWCLWNLGLLEAKDVLNITHKDNLFPEVLHSEWMKVSDNTEDSWNVLKEEAKRIKKNHSLHPRKINQVAQTG